MRASPSPETARWRPCPDTNAGTSCRWSASRGSLPSALADTLDQLQEQVDSFDLIYNTERPHQGLPGRITPQHAWEATPKVEPPRPVPQPAAPLSDMDGVRVTRIRDNGTVVVRQTRVAPPTLSGLLLIQHVSRQFNQRLTPWTLGDIINSQVY